MSKNIDVSELVRRLRSLLADVHYTDEPDFLGKDDTLVRFLKSREWDVAAAEKMLRRSVAWRLEFRPQHVQCDYCRTNPGVHTLRQIGFDEAQRPVIYASFFPAHVSQRSDTQEVLTHLIYVIENAIRSMSPGVSQWVFIIDCAGMTLTGCHPRLGYECAQVMSNHYPERLGLAICIRPGSAFKVAWQAIKPFLPQTTAGKVCILTSKSKMQSVLEKYFSYSMTEWIMREYKSNRRNPTVARYRPFWVPYVDESNKVSHDPRGEKQYVDNWIKVSHPTGHKPHPNIMDHLEGKLQSSLSLPTSTKVTDDYGEEEEAEDVDEVTVKKLLETLPNEFKIPSSAEKLS